MQSCSAVVSSVSQMWYHFLGTSRSTVNKRNWSQLGETYCHTHSPALFYYYKMVLKAAVHSAVQLNNKHSNHQTESSSYLF